MTIKARPTFTPEYVARANLNISQANICRLLVEAPRPSDGVPNETGTHALYTVSRYSVEGNSNTTEVRVMQIEAGASQLFSDDPSVKEPQWLTAHLIMWKKVKESGESEIWAANATGDKKYRDSEPAIEILTLAQCIHCRNRRKRYLDDQDDSIVRRVLGLHIRSSCIRRRQAAEPQILAQASFNRPRMGRRASSILGRVPFTLRQHGVLHHACQDRLEVQTQQESAGGRIPKHRVYISVHYWSRPIRL
jgi:hypothetical protein